MKANIKERHGSIVEQLSSKTGVAAADVSKVLETLGLEGVLNSVAEYAPDKINAENLKVGIRISSRAIDV